MKLIPVVSKDQVEWLRIQRNRPELYKYFRQDAEITPEQQAKWWRGLPKSHVKLFLISEEIDGRTYLIGYVGFNPLNQYAMTAEFGIFIIPEFQRKGYGTRALLELLRRGFTEYNISSIYSDILTYPGEERFAIYESLGFVKYPDYSQNLRYKKQGVWIPSIKFYMTKDIWNELYGKKGKNTLGPFGKKAAGVLPKKKEGKSPSVHPGENYIHALA